MAAITISNLRISPYTQKNTIKPVYGDTLTLTFALPEPFMEGDDYILALDYERVLVPTARPLCAMTSEYTVDGGNITFALELRTARFRDWVSTIKKPMPVWLQIQRKRDGVYDTILLDDVLALPSVADGDNTVFPGDPLEELLDEKLDKPAEGGDAGDVLTLGADGKPVWGNGGGGGGGDVAWDDIEDKPDFAAVATSGSYDDLSNKPDIPAPQAQADWDESDSSEPSYIQNKPEIPPVQEQSDWDESDSSDVAYIKNKPEMDYIPTSDKGAANGVATLDASGKVPYSQMPVLMLDSAPTTSTAGHLTQQSFVTPTGKCYQCIGIDSTDPNAPVYQWAECITSAMVNAANGVAGLDANSKVPSGNLPAATVNGTLGAVKLGPLNYGLTIEGSTGRLYLVQASNGQIDVKAGTSVIITPVNAPYAVRSVLPNVTTIPAATTEYSLKDASATTNNHSWQYFHAPAEASTYTFPAVTDTTVAHHITLNVYFRGYARSSDDDSGSAYAWKDGTDLLYTDTATPTATETVVYSDTALTANIGTVALYESNMIALAASASFEDSAGNDIVPKSTPTIKPGTVVQYLCEWEPCTSQWVIMPIPMVDGGAA